MSNALIKRGRRRGNLGGVVPAACSALIPGLGQLVNGDSDKALGVFVVAAVSGASFLGAIPLVGSVAGLVWFGTWVYGVADGFFEGRKKR